MPWDVVVPVLVVAAIALWVGRRMLPDRHDERRR